MPANAAENGVPSFVTRFIQGAALKKAHDFSWSYESIDAFSDFYIVPQNHRNSASHNLTSEKSFRGHSSHKAWIYSENPQQANTNTNHRAYPTLQLKKTKLGIVKTAVLVEFYVWADIELFPKEGKDWFSLATFTSYDDTQWARSYLINVDRNYKVHLMHVPAQGKSRPDITPNQQVTLPRQKWSKITAYIDYTRDNRFASPMIAVWVDGVIASASTFNDRIAPDSFSAARKPKCLDGWAGQLLAEAEKLCGLKYEAGLAQLHLGLYAPPLLTQGVIYNDELSISEIIRSDF